MHGADGGRGSDAPTVSHDGLARTGANPAARADALRRVPAFLDALP